MRGRAHLNGDRKDQECAWRLATSMSAPLGKADLGELSDVGAESESDSCGVAMNASDLDDSDED